MDDMQVLEIESELFAQRLAELLLAERREQGMSRSTIARQSVGRFSSAELRRIEAGRTTLTPEMVHELTGLYAVDPALIIAERSPIAITPGSIAVGGAKGTFVGTDATSLLTAYLRLIRSLRDQRRAEVIVLRREDIESLAAYLGEDGADVVGRLGVLMGATRTERTSMMALFATGAAVIGIVGLSAMAHGAAGSDHVSGSLRSGAAVATVTVGTTAQLPAVTADAPVLATTTALDRAAPAAESSTLTPSTTTDSTAADATVADQTPTAATPAATTPTADTPTVAASVADAPVVDTDTVATPAAATPAAATPAASTGTTRSTAVSQVRPATSANTAAAGSDTVSSDSTASTGVEQADVMPSNEVIVASEAVAPPIVAVADPPVPTTPTYAVADPPVPTTPTYAVAEPPVPTYSSAGQAATAGTASQTETAPEVTTADAGTNSTRTTSSRRLESDIGTTSDAAPATPADG